MTQIRWYTDEDVFRAIALELRRHGYDAISASEAGNLGWGDPDHLAFANQTSRVLITFNVGDFSRLHTECLSTGGNHAGVVVSGQRGIGDVLRRLLNLGGALSAEDMRDRLEFLGTWPS